MPGLPTDSTQLSDLSSTLLLDEFAGLVDTQFAKASMMRNFVTVRPVRGTDTLVANRVGRTDLIKLTPGVRPDVTATGYGQVAVTVDTVILARDYRSMLNEFQAHFDARMELATDQGKELGKFFDQAFIIQTIKGAGQAAPSGLNSAIGAGKSTTLAAANDELDPDKLYTAITNIIVAMEDEDIPVDELVVFVRPRQFEVLKNNNKLMSTDYSSGNGDFARGQLHYINGARIVKTARIPTAAISGHLLSNAANSNAYDVSATEAKAVAVIMHPNSLFAGETIPLQSDIWFNREEKQWFIDSFIAFAVTVRRPDVCGRVLRF